VKEYMHDISIIKDIIKKEENNTQNEKKKSDFFWRGSLEEEFEVIIKEKVNSEMLYSKLTFPFSPVKNASFLRLPPLNRLFLLSFLLNILLSNTVFISKFFILLTLYVCYY
jgi:hypothetical protein